MHTLIRIEHKKSKLGLYKARKLRELDMYYIGIYNDFSFCRGMLKRHAQLPTPQEEGISIEEDEFCAFLSIDNLYDWILKYWIEEIVSFGFSIYQLKVSKANFGKYQATFKKSDVISKRNITAKLLSTLQK